jgi:hypothetical protein
MNFIGRAFRAIFLLAALTSMVASVAAQNPSMRGAPRQNASGGMCHLRYLNGSVSIQPHGTGDWVTGFAHQALGNADNVWADKDSRAELNFGTGFMRIDAESSLTLTEVREGVRVFLHQGSLNVRVHRLGSGYEVDTPNLSFTLSQPGDYRFDVPSDGNSAVVTVREGEAAVAGQGAAAIRAGQQAHFSGSNAQAQIQDAPKPDGFDDWGALRDRTVDSRGGDRNEDLAGPPPGYSPNGGPGGPPPGYPPNGGPQAGMGPGGPPPGGPQGEMGPGGPPPAPEDEADDRSAAVSAGGKWRKFETRDPMTNVQRVRFQLEADNPLRDSISNAKINVLCAKGDYVIGRFVPNVRTRPTNPGFWGQPQVQVVTREDNHHDTHGWNWDGRFLAMDKDTVRRLVGSSVFKVELPGPQEGNIASFSPAGLDLTQFENACHLKPKN